MTKSLKGAMSKSDELTEALGSVDELNSWIGWCRGQLMSEKKELRMVDKQLKRIQTNLLMIGSGMAGSTARDLKTLNQETKKLEKLIDKLTEQMPKLANFIYPTGGLQAARAVCRRAERATVRYMSRERGLVNKAVLKYLNRLSDGLFTLARWVDQQTGKEEEVWR